ncbi:MAG: HlyC/CorC family transporter [Chloroflexi bacterium]|nr:HlyC/CorC family transporter [Chloroflexota bacterium]
MSSIIIIIATVALMIFFNALYVAAEFATVSSRRTRISQLAGQGNRMAQMLLPIMEDSKALDNYVAACQVGITISSLVVGAYGQNVIAARLIGPMTTFMDWISPILGNGGEGAAAAAESLAAVIVLVLITILQVIMGELFPKSVAIQFPERVAMMVVVPMKWSLLLLRPLIALFNGSGRLILRLMGHTSGEKHGQAHSPEEIELLVTESHEVGLLEDSERQMLRNAFRLRDLTARQVMIHRTRLTAASENSGILEILEVAIAAGYSRIPIYRDSIDDIIGFVHVKDLFRLHVQSRDDLTSIIREVIYVPEMLPAADVWEKLSATRKYLTIVFDEYGGTAGIITFEDLIEEIFGELQDEFDDEMALIARDKQGRIYLRGDLLITDVNEYLDLNLPEEEADTLSGLIFNELGRPPQNGEEATVGDVAIRVEAMADLGVSEVSLQLSPSDDAFTISDWEVADYE